MRNMESAIEAIQDKIIYLTGRIHLTKDESISQIAKKVVVIGWDEEIEQLKNARDVLIDLLKKSNDDKILHQYCECEKPTLGNNISRCGNCDKWFKSVD